MVGALFALSAALTHGQNTLISISKCISDTYHHQQNSSLVD
ncbi:hypothetical protein VIC_002137 [Vibrio coralliilyticus ATCC BAA-450]|nr:hypothetical protein VIC_002137 [Vibrio coralliilyticus ATCC BAA-450]